MHTPDPPRCPASPALTLPSHLAPPATSCASSAPGCSLATRQRRAKPRVARAHHATGTDRVVCLVAAVRGRPVASGRLGVCADHLRRGHPGHRREQPAGAGRPSLPRHAATAARSRAPHPPGVGRWQARFSPAERVCAHGRGHACAASGAGGRTSRLAIWRSISACMAACSSRAFDIMSAISPFLRQRHLVTSRVPCRRVHAPSRAPQRRDSHAPARPEQTSQFWRIVHFGESSSSLHRTHPCAPAPVSVVLEEFRVSSVSILNSLVN